jgi:RimJ/RimL family protein N-acetyltransferase
MIRKAADEDIAFIYGLYMHPAINPWLLYELMNIETFRPIYTDLLQKGIKYIFLQEGQPVGMFKLIPLTHRTDHIAYLGGVAIDPGFGGKGYGQQLISEILSFSRQQGFKRVELSTATINEKAIRLYEKNGFVKEGVLKNYTYLKKEGKFLDEVMMAVLIDN